MAILFVTYTGVLEPLGRSQVLPYVLGLAEKGHAMTLLSFERGSRSAERRQVATALERRGIDWISLRYHKHPRVLSTACDVALGLAATLRRRRIELIHARSHVPALVADIARTLRGTPFLFDHRGLMADEYADAGVWSRGSWLHRMTERFERRFLRTSRKTVVLTDAYRRELGEPERVFTIPCAVDLARFRPARSGEGRPYDLVYSGSVTGLYLLRDTLLFFDAYRTLAPEARLLILTASRPPGVDQPGVETRQSSPEEVPGLLRQARAGLSFRAAGRAQIASSPVKVSEYLASGLPVVSSAGVGDLDELLPGNQVGVVLPDASQRALQLAARRLRELLIDGDAVTERCRRLAEERYDLAAAISAYDGLYRTILAGGEAA